MTHVIIKYSIQCIAIWIITAIGTCSSVIAQTVTFGPSPYLGFAVDSPFSALDFSQFHLEDFEDGLANTPGLVLPAGANVGLQGMVGSTTFLDSVFEDYGPDDGFVGGSVFVDQGITPPPIVISFDDSVLGSFPTHVGVVVTDLQVYPTVITVADVTVTAYDSGGLPLGAVTDPNFGDSNTLGGTAEDRFFGFAGSVGIAKIEITSTKLLQIELDHIQFGTIKVAPDELLQELILTVADINLANGMSNSLDKKLENALDALLSENADDRHDAVNKLFAFINSVEAQRGKEISDTDADLLVDLALEVIAALMA